MQSDKHLRVAWLLPIAWFYWQPFLGEFSQRFPKTTVFTGLFPGFVHGLEEILQVRVIGRVRVIEVNRDEESYGDNFTYLSLSIIKYLFQFKPQVIFSSSFGIWTILALALKPLFWWRVVIAYEGSSPGVDYRHSALRLWVRRLMVRLADVCITNSQAGKSYLVDILHGRKDQVFSHPYEVPDEKTLPGAGDINDNFSQWHRPLFLFVGHLIPRKGLPLLLEACAILQARGYDQYTLLVVGDGAQKEELANFCQAHNLSDRVQWTGRVNYDQIGSYFKGADVFVMPTLEDTWGVVTLEAMLMGKPILCSKGAGTSELVAHGDNGYVFSPDDANELADLMQKFLDEPELIEVMGARSQAIMAKYTPAAAAEWLAKITELAMAS